ncbi:polysaccharide deacetylase family protein [Microlunatus parietis]|uniref:Peptidoglycan/xylan/chitin deacetylase (PgdA/CDA1 family) n=1 Tax=Microlunatus parietis TaxID=682979 RepID=A0A7Y9IBA0_9ACTN|nr:peptidoglycan/xylan/chitin deacetylase (PgdA/CDA1 family) [Microlunatus parietis]
MTLIIVGICLLELLLVLGGGYRLMNSRTVQIAGRLVDRVDTAEKVVALTFDDGPTGEADADAMLQTLADRDVRATFYLNGNGIERFPGVAARLVDAGHELGNHTWSHPRMILLPPSEIARQVSATDRLIRQAGYEGEITFRPPYGKKLLTLPLYLAATQRTTVTWDVAADSEDSASSAEDLAAATVANTRPGSIILLHPWYGRSATQQAIGMIIDDLHRQGYRFVTVSELIDG